MISKLTTEQDEKLNEVINKWKTNLLDYKWLKSNTEEKMIQNTKEMYKFCGFTEPRVIVCDSPLECQIIANTLKGENYNHKINDVMCSETKISQVYLKNKIATLFSTELLDEIKVKINNVLQEQVLRATTEQVEDKLYDDVMHAGEINRNLDIDLIISNILADDANIFNELNELVKKQIYFTAKGIKSPGDNLIEKIKDKLVKKIDLEVTEFNKIRENNLRQLSDSEILNVVGNNVIVVYSKIIKHILDEQLGLVSIEDLKLAKKTAVDPGAILVVYHEIIPKIRKQIDNTYLGIFMPENANYNEIDEYISISFYFNVTDMCWQPFFDFVINELNLISGEEKEAFNRMVEFSTSVSYSIQYEDICIVSKYPSEISLDANNTLHNTDDYAIKYVDGYGQGYFHGRYIEPQVFNALKTGEYTFDEWTKEPNEEVKSMILTFYNEKFGGEFAFRFLSAYLKEVDTYIDKKDTKYLENTVKSMNIGTYTLFKGQVNNTEIAYVRCYCPSTDRMFFLGVNPQNNNAKDAIASLCQIPKKLKNEIVSVARQGEIFSFNFTQKGNEIVKKLNTEELRDVVSLSGEEYFKKMKFEY